MVDLEQENPEPNNEKPAEQGVDQVDQTRRRLTGAGLAGSGVLLTLASHPVLGGTYTTGGNQCTKSAILSGNLSHQQDTTQCGCSPGYWGQHPEVWANLTDNLYLPNMLFNAVFGRTVFVTTTTLLQVAQQSISPPLGFPTPNGCKQNGNNFYNNIRVASFQAVAALLNAATFAWRYLPLYDTPQKVINAYQAAFDTAAMDCGSALNQLKTQWDQYNNLYCGYDAHGNYK